jgi:hypothetical protein
MLSNKSKRSNEERSEPKKSRTNEDITERPYAVGKAFYHDREEFSRKVVEGSAVLSYRL